MTSTSPTPHVGHRDRPGRVRRGPLGVDLHDVIRYVDSNGRLATGDGDAMFHNTLAASDYALLDEDGPGPRPNYWAAVLWHRLMGPAVLDVVHHPAPDLSVYAHCTPGAEDERHPARW